MISLKSYAREVGVQDKRFLENLMNSYYGWFVQDDLREGLERGVTDIPAVFVDGVRFEKDPSLNNLRNHLQELKQNLKVVGIRQKKRA
jgi:hypothetical protein